MHKNSRGNWQESDESLFDQLSSKYIPYWPIFLISLLAGAMLSFIYLRYTNPVYQANATIIIMDEKKGNEDSKLLESLDLISSKKIIENEIEIIRSRTLVDQVVKDLFLYAPLYEKGRIHRVSAYTRSPVLIEVVDPSSLQVMIESSDPDSLRKFDEIDISYNKNNQTVVVNSKYVYPINRVVATPFGLLKFVSNIYCRANYSDRRKKKMFFSLIHPENSAEELSKNLTVEASNKLSSVIELRYKDEVPKRAENILNELIAAYDQFEIKGKNKLALNTISFVEDRLNEVIADLNSIEKRVQQFKSQKGAVDVSTQGQLYLQSVSANDQKISELNMQLSVLNQVQKFVTDKNNDKAIVPSTLGVSDPSLSQLTNKLYNSELEYDRLKNTVGENNPTLLSIKDEINKIKPKILQTIQSQQQNLNAAKQNLYSTSQNYKSVLQTVPQKERELLDVSREQATKSNIYAFLLQKREESKLAYASAVSNHLVVDNAKSQQRPVSPKKLIVFLTAIASCMILSFLIVTLKETFTGKVLYRHQIGTYTSIPVIGEVAYNKSKTPLVIEAGKRSFIAEEFRKLRNSLSYLGINSSHKKILVTSSISGEGKSFIATNLAVSIALTGKKVVLVDMDLNNPSISKILKINPEAGITEFLMGKKEPEVIINNVKAFDNLYFISAGNLPENPTELLMNGRVDKIIEFLDANFDLVIIDTSPVVLVTDAYILSALCDATLYIIRHKYTPKILVERIDENNEINPINNPAIIFNGVKMRGFFKNNYGYGYDYVYGNRERGKKDNNLHPSRS